MVEVFANSRQAVMHRVYPSLQESVGVALFSRGGSASVGYARGLGHVHRRIRIERWLGGTGFKALIAFSSRESVR